MKVELTYVGDELFVRFFPIKKSPIFSISQKNEVEEFVKKYHRSIVKKWHNFFENSKKPVCHKINEPISSKKAKK